MLAETDYPVKTIYRTNLKSFKPIILRAVLALMLSGLFCLNLIANSAMQQPRDPVIWSVSFEGNESYSNIVLRNTIAARSPNWFQKLFRRFDNFYLNERELRRDRIRLMRYYQRRGYDQVEIDLDITEEDDEWKRNVLFRIREGEPIQITSSTITIAADSAVIQEFRDLEQFQQQERQHEYREGRRYQTIREADVEGRFNEIMQNHGYPWAEARVEADIDSLAKSADVNVIINPGPKSWFTNFGIEGGTSVSNRIILRETEIDSGEVYDRRKIQHAQRQLFSHHLFRFATITIPDQPQDSTLDLNIRVRENPLRTIQASIGLGSEELLRGQVNWQHRNITGNAHRLGINARASFIEQRFSMDYLIPFVFNARSSLVSSPFIQRRLEPSYELMTLGFNNSLIYQLRRYQTATLSYEFTSNEEISTREDVSLPDSVLEYTVSSLLLTGYYSQGISREPKGWVIRPSAEFSGTFGEATYTFQKLALDVRHYAPLSRSTTVAGRINAGTIFYTQSDSLPANIRFYTGGTNSVRGWSRQSLGPKRPTFDEGEFDGYLPIGGRAVFSFNIELRQQIEFLISGFGIGLFLDGGQVWRAIDRIDERPLQFGAGGGLRYQSPIGPVRIDIGYKLNPTDRDLNHFGGVDHGSAWSRIGIHFSIGQAF